jgi:phospholipid/cholesterol/gamma-HCH transport system permease protein
MHADDVSEVRLIQRPFTVMSLNGRSVQTHTLIVATGAAAKRLPLDSEKEFWGRGVSACAVCDGGLPLFRGKELAVLGWMVVRLLACFIPRRGRSKPFYKAQYYRALAEVGANSVAIVSTIAACTGIILSLQSALQLERLGAMSWVPSMVSAILVKELGPLLTAIIVTGRSGAAFAAEVATMQISEELDALEVMGLEPVRFIVWPKFLAMVIMVPCLTIVADVVGITAGGIFSAAFLGISGDVWYEQTLAYLKPADLYSGLVKSLGFAVCITLIGCWQGFLARAGAEDVGRRTTRAVVQSIFIIVLLDLYFTGLLYIIN